MAWSVFNLGLKFGEKVQPTTLLADRFRCTIEVGERCMVSAHGNVSPEQVLPVFLEAEDHGQHLFSGDAVSTFGSRQGSASIGNDVDQSIILLLLEYCTQGKVRSVGIQNIFSMISGRRQDRS